MAVGSGTGTQATGSIPVTVAFESRQFFSAVWIWDNSAMTYVNRTVEANTVGGTAFAIFEDINDRLYLGSESRFDLAAFELSVAGAGLGTLTYNFYRADQWVQFSPNLNYDFTVDGAETLDRLDSWSSTHFTNGDPHSAAPPDSSSRYWIRISSSAVGTAPTVNRIQMRPYAAYCTATDVANLLQLSDFTSTTMPTRNTVEDYIHAAQSLIDWRTRKSWRLNFKKDEEHQFNISGFKLYEYYPRAITLLEVWDGGSYTTRTQGRTSDYFLVAADRMVYFARFFILPARLQSYNAPVWQWGWGEFNYPVRISYFHGSNIFTNEREGGLVFDITRKLAAIDVLSMHRHGIRVASGADVIALDRTTENWKMFVEENLDALRPFISY